MLKELLKKKTWINNYQIVKRDLSKRNHHKRIVKKMLLRRTCRKRLIKESSKNIQREQNNRFRILKKNYSKIIIET